MMCRLSIFAGLALAHAAPAADLVHYLDLHCLGTNLEVRVNGFDITSNFANEGFTHSTFLTPYLVDGDNRIEVDYRRTDDEAGAAGWIEFEIAAAPPDFMRTTAEPGEILVRKRIEASPAIALPAAEGAFEVLAGEMAPDTGPVEFTAQGERRWAFGVRMNEPIPGIPASLTYSGLNQTLALAELHLVSSADGKKASFRNLKFPAGGGTLELGPANLARGLVPGESGYDQLWLFGFSAPEVGAVRMLRTELAPPNTAESATVDFPIDLAFEWSWSDGDTLAAINRDDKLRTNLVAFLEELHATLDSEPAENWAPHFEAKAADLSKATGTPIDQVRAGQRKFFADLVAMEHWGLEPFDPARLLLTPVGGKIVAVSYIDSHGPIVSVPLMKPGAKEPDRFTMPLHLARIDGQWQVVR